MSLIMNLIKIFNEETESDNEIDESNENNFKI